MMIWLVTNVQDKKYFRKQLYYKILKSFDYQYFETTRIRNLFELVFVLGDLVTVLHITFIVWWCCTAYGETDHDSKIFNTNDKFLWHKYVTHYFFAGNKKLTCPWFLEQFSRTYSMYTAEYFTQFSVYANKKYAMLFV